MKEFNNKKCYLEGNALIFIENDHRTTRVYATDSDAQGAYDAIPSVCLPAPWPVKTRAEARLAGDTYYYTGRLCDSNHGARRYVSTGACIPCHAKFQETSRRRALGETVDKATLRCAVPRCSTLQLRDFVASLNAKHNDKDCKECGDDTG